VTPALVISASDNVATALETLDAGRTIRFGDLSVVVAESIPRGHKLALREIRAGEAVVKFGSAIGAASTRIAPGTHVHTHNVASARGRGDLQIASTPQARIAEPADLAGIDAGDEPAAHEPDAT
jgi:altronate dehydratase